MNLTPLAFIIEEDVHDGEDGVSHDSIFSSAWSSFHGKKIVGEKVDMRETPSQRLRRIESAMADEGPATWMLEGQPAAAINQHELL